MNPRIRRHSWSTSVNPVTRRVTSLKHVDVRCGDSDLELSGRHYSSVGNIDKDVMMAVLVWIVHVCLVIMWGEIDKEHTMFSQQAQANTSFWVVGVKVIFELSAKNSSYWLYRLTLTLCRAWGLVAVADAQSTACIRSHFPVLRRPIQWRSRGSCGHLSVPQTSDRTYLSPITLVKWGSAVISTVWTRYL